MQKKFVIGAVLGGVLSAGVFLAVSVLSERPPVQGASASLSDSDSSMRSAPDSRGDALPPSSKRADNVVEGLLPAEIPEKEMRAKVDLWEKSKGDATTTIDGIPAITMRVDPEVLDEFHVGQQLALEIPQRDTSLLSQIVSTHNQAGGVKVWKAAIENGHPQDNVIVTQGSIETHVIVSTLEGTYTAVIDNKTGKTSLIDEGEIAARTVPTEDGIRLEPVDDSPPLG